MRATTCVGSNEGTAILLVEPATLCVGYFHAVRQLLWQGLVDPPEDAARAAGHWEWLEAELMLARDSNARCDSKILHWSSCLHG